MTEYAIFRFFIYPKTDQFRHGFDIRHKMIESMNVAMSNMSVPGSMTNYLPSENDTASTQLWYAVIEGLPVGPLDKKEMLSFLLNKKSQRIL